jgi:hypothetical protein
MTVEQRMKDSQNRNPAAQNAVGQQNVNVKVKVETAPNLKAQVKTNRGQSQ